MLQQYKCQVTRNIWNSSDLTNVIVFCRNHLQYLTIVSLKNSDFLSKLKHWKNCLCNINFIAKTGMLLYITVNKILYFVLVQHKQLSLCIICRRCHHHNLSPLHPTRTTAYLHTKCWHSGSGHWYTSSHHCRYDQRRMYYHRCWDQ